MKKKSIIKLSITAVILIALGCWINSRWNAWFGNPPEAVYSPLNEPGRILLTFGDENALSRNISWQYDYRVGQGHYCPLPPSEPYVRVSPHTAQAFQSLCSCAETGSSYFLFPLFFTG